MRKLLPLALLCLILIFYVGEARADSEWIDGIITSNPQSMSYGVSVWVFDFNVESTSGTLSGNVTCLLMTFGNAEPHMNDRYNFTGMALESNDTIPFNAFFVTSINTNETSTDGNETSNTNEWITGLQTVFDTMSGIGKQIVTSIVAFCEMVKFPVPDYVVAFVLLGVTGLLGWIRIHWIVSLLSFGVGLTVVCYVAQTYLQLLLGIAI